MPQTETAADPDVPAFADELRVVMAWLRAALLQLHAGSGLPSTRPQEVSRRLGLNKNLTWKVSRIIGASDPFEAVSHVPGTAGMQILLDAFVAGGARPEDVGAVRDAMKSFDALIALHAGDRATLDLLVASHGPRGGRAELLLSARQKAFLGNSSTFGVQARLQFSTAILAPADDGRRADYIQFSGLLGLRRLRPDVRWMVTRHFVFHDDGSPLPGSFGEPLDPRGPLDGVPLLRDFCSRPLPKLEIVQDGVERQVELPGGPVGNTAALDVVYGIMARSAVSAYRTPEDTIAQIGCTLVTPVEALQFDLLVHEDMPWDAPEPALFSRLDGSRLVNLASSLDRNRLELVEDVTDLGPGLAALATPEMPRYTELVALALQRGGWDAARFRGYRITMRVPPIPTSLFYYWDLAEDAPAG
ncbi:MAG: hypothetical protein H6825_07065 [Planctomycetes bacterium]|nr:hypothetical protein [Planctomycetota bacterium]